MGRLKPVRMGAFQLKGNGPRQLDCRSPQELKEDNAHFGATMNVRRATLGRQVSASYSAGVTRVQNALNTTESKKAEARTIRPSRMSRNQA